MATNFDLEILIKARNQIQGTLNQMNAQLKGAEAIAAKNSKKVFDEYGVKYNDKIRAQLKQARDSFKVQKTLVTNHGKTEQQIAAQVAAKARQVFIRETQSRLKIAAKLLDIQDKASSNKKGGLLSRLFGGGGGGGIRESMMLSGTGARPRIILAGILGIAAGVAYFIGKLVIAEQQIKVTFDLLYSDANRGKNALASLDQVAGNATFGHAAIDSAGASMLNYGYSLDTTLRSVQALSDANAALGNSGDQVAAQAKAIAQMNETGFVTGGQVSALEAGGIPALRLLSGGNQKKALGIQNVISRGAMRSGPFLAKLNTALENQYSGAAATRVSTPQGRLGAFIDQASRGDFSSILRNAPSPAVNRRPGSDLPTTKGLMQNASGANVADTVKNTTAVWRVINLFSSRLIMRFKSVFLSLRSDWQTIYKDIIKWWNQNIIKWLDDNIMTLPDRIISWFQNIPNDIANTWSTINADIVTWWDANIALLNSYWNNIVTDVGNFFSPISQFIANIWNSVAKDVITWWDSIDGNLSSYWNNIVISVNNILNPISQFIANIWQNIINDVYNYWNFINNSFNDLINPIARFIMDTFNTVWTFLAGVWQGINDDATNGWRSIYNTIVGYLNSIISTINSSGIPGLLGGNIPTIPTMQASNNSNAQNITVSMNGAIIYGFEDFQSQVVSAINTAQRAGRI